MVLYIADLQLTEPGPQPGVQHRNAYEFDLQQTNKLLTPTVIILVYRIIRIDAAEKCREAVVRDSTTISPSSHLKGDFIKSVSSMRHGDALLTAIHPNCDTSYF